MKYLILLAVSVTAIAQPNFKKIFKEIKAKNLISESIMVRQNYLSQMRDLKDFDRLTNLELIGAGESFFSRYQKELSYFITNNLEGFVSKKRPWEKKIFLNNILPKIIDEDYFIASEIGLEYIENCKEFLAYTKRYNSELREKYFADYCHNELSQDGASTRYVPVLMGTRILSAGQWQKITFDNYYKVKRIFFSVEGVGQDTYFDVLVNGKTVGTIYAPGADPSYIVNVNEFAGEIVLRSLNNGSARIISVTLEVEDI